MSGQRIRLLPNALAAALWLVSILPHQGAATAQPVNEPTDPRTSDPRTGYRRVFVPVNRPDEWPTAGDRYLPIDRVEFEKLASAASQRAALGEDRGAHLDSAHYSARLERGDLVGDLAFDVRLVDDFPRILPLEGLNVAVSEARWMNGAAAKGALVGRWRASNDRHSAVGVLVNESGRLAANWRLHGPGASAGEQEFRLRLPPALQQEFVIVLPREYTASMLPISPAELSASGDDAQRWLFKLAPASEHLLKIHGPSSESPRTSKLPLVATSESYSVSSRGLEYEAEFRIQRRLAEQGMLSLALPTGLRVSEMLVDGSPAASSQNHPDAKALTLTLPTSPGPLTVVLRALGPIVLDKPWKLPRIVPQQSLCTEGSTTLWIDSALELQAIVPESATLVNLVGLDDPTGGEAYRWQHLSSDAAAEVTISHRAAQLHAQTATVAEFADRELAGRCRARFWATGADLYHIEATLAPDWNLESLEANPPEGLVEWHVAGVGSQRRLHLQLRRTPTQAEPVTLSVSARKPLRGWAPTATLAELDWIRFRGSAVDAGPLLVTDLRDGEISVSSHAAGAVRPLSSLTPRERQLLGDPDRGLLLSVERAPPDAAVQVATSNPRYRADAWIELTRTETGFRHQAIVQCRPTEGAISTLTVATSRPLPEDTEWLLESTGESLKAERLTDNRPGDPAESRTTTYRLRLPKPQSSAFELSVAWLGEKADDTVVGITLPEANAWMAWAVLRGNPDAVRVRSNGSAPASAIPTDEADGEPPILACFRLSDDPSTPSATTPSLEVVPPGLGKRGDAVTSWLCDVTTLQFPDGRQAHRFLYDLESTHAESIEFQAPNDLQIVSARLNGRSLGTSAELQAVRTLRAEIPTRGVGNRLVIDLTGQRARLNSTTSLEFVVPRTSFDVARTRWTVCTPSPYAVESPVTRQAAPWRQRLFGPLVDARPESPRQPMSQSSREASEDLSLADGAPAHGAIAPPRWSQATQTFVSAPIPMEIRRIDESRAARHAVWLAAAVAAGLFWLRWSRWVVFVALASAVACLVLPLQLVSLAQALFLGSLAGAFVREILARTGGAKLDLTDRRVPRAAVLALSAGLLLAERPLSAADRVAPARAVLFPVDDLGQPEGDDVYAPASLLNELLPTTLQSRHGGATSLLQAATYRIDLAEAPGGDIACQGAELRFTVQTFGRGVRLALPLVRGDAQWIAEDHTLNGAPAQLAWNDQGNRCTLLVDEPGSHELILRMKPIVSQNARQQSVVLHVPRLPETTIEIHHPAGMSDLAVNSEPIDAAELQSTPTRVRLPMSDVLNVAWGASRPQSSMDVAVDQLSWLKILPASAELEVRLRVSGDVANLSTLELTTPPQLKLVEPADDASLIQVSSEPGLSSKTKLNFAASAKSPVVVALRFQLQRSISIGVIDFPIVAPLTPVKGIRQYAVSVDSQLQTRDVLTADLSPAALTEVEQVWGALDEPPSTVLTATGGDPAWTMQVQPANQPVAARETMELVVSAKHATVTYRAAIDSAPNAAGALVQRLKIPPALQVEQASVSSDDAQETTRWSRPSADELCIFTSRPVGGPHRITIVGTLPHNGQRLTVPRIGLEPSAGASLAVTVLRDRQTLVEPPGDVAAFPTVQLSADQPVLPVAQLSIPRDDASLPELRISRNDPRLEADVALSIDASGPTPEAAMVIQGRVLRGLVDRVRLTVGSSLIGPLRADAGVEASITPIASDDERHIIEASLPKLLAAGDEFVIKLTSALAPDVDQRMRLPQIRVLDATDQRLFLILPMAPSGQTVEWTLRRLREVELPSALAEAIDVSPSTTAYLAQGDRYVAEQRVFPVALRAAVVRFADAHATIDAHGDWSAITQLVVQPGGGSEVSVTVPQGAKLRHASVDGNPITIERDASTVRVPDGSRFLPRLVSVAYQQASNHETINLQLPEVQVDRKKLRVSRALWSVAGERTDELAISGFGAQLNEDAFRRSRRREYRSAVLEASALAFQLPEWELANWFRAWIDRLESAGVPGGSPDRDEQESQWANLQGRLVALNGFTQTPVDSPRDQHALTDVDSAAAWFSSGPEGSLRLIHSRGGSGIGRWLLAIGLVGVGATLWRSPRRYDRAIAAFRRWPGLVGVALGLAWWWMLTPSLLGLAIVALSLAALIKQWQSASRNQLPVSAETTASLAT